MKTFTKYLITLPLMGLLTNSVIAAEGADPRLKNMVSLSEQGVKNLQIETVQVGEQVFETTAFAIGRIEEIPANHSVLSSRISGRVVKMNVFEGDKVKAGDVLAVVESRQPGNPPPTIELKASQSGVVTESHIRVGQPVEPDLELLDISDRSEVWAIAKIPEQEAANIVPGKIARIRIPALGGDPIEATLIRYGVSADRNSSTLEGIFQLSNADGRLIPGMRAEFSIITKTRDDVLAVPKAAIQGDPARRIIFVKDFELPNMFIRSEVELGEQNDRYVEIVNGVFPGDEVVTRGSYSLGFAGEGSGPSLKEWLDAAHGHKHAEDGSELSPAQLAAEKAASSGGAGGGGSSKLVKPLAIYGGVMTLAFLAALQSVFTGRKKGDSSC
jgi:cobalt-zinc-cadmium efflux system membrane fusion protein